MIFLTTMVGNVSLLFTSYGSLGKLPFIRAEMLGRVNEL